MQGWEADWQEREADELCQSQVVVDGPPPWQDRLRLSGVQGRAGVAAQPLSHSDGNQMDNLWIRGGYWLGDRRALWV